MTEPARFPRARRGALLLALLAALPVAELSLRLLGGYDSGEARDRVRALRENATAYEEPALEDDRVRGDPQPRVLNPYYGYDTRAGFDLLEGYVELHRRSDRAEFFTVLICGGSVAEVFVGIARGGAERLVELLEADASLSGRRVKPLRFARAGYKQPQQLEKLAYFLSRGCVPDAVINIDGLNEVRGGLRNLSFGVHPTFPPATHWLHLAQDAETDYPRAEALVAARAAQAQLLQEVDRALDREVFRSALWGRWTERRIRALYGRWSASQARFDELLLASQAPPEPSGEAEAAALEECLIGWAESSRLMHDLCRARGVAYLHVLQPTLHDPGSKVITPEERRRCIGEDGLDPRVEIWYGALRERGAALAEAGVPFVDASDLFEGVDETLYFDKAHFGKAGNARLAELLASELLQRTVSRGR